MSPVPLDANLTRLLDAALVCIARVGVAKTTLDDVAREAGVSRATLYRCLPGKQALLDALVVREAERIATALTLRLGRPATLSDALVGLLVGAAEELETHAALRFVLEHEPDVLLPHLAFDGADRLLAIAGAIGAPHLAPFLGTHADRGAQWVARLLLSYLASPSETTDLSDPDSVRRLVDCFVEPGLSQLALSVR